MKIKNRVFLILKWFLVNFLLFSLLKNRSLKIKKILFKYKNIRYYLIFYLIFFSFFFYLNNNLFIYIYNIIKLIYK